MENEIDVGRVKFDWNPVSLNRVFRFFRFYKYLQKVIDDESLKIKQSFEIKLKNLHNHQSSEFNDDSGLKSSPSFYRS